MVAPRLAAMLLSRQAPAPAHTSAPRQGNEGSGSAARGRTILSDGTESGGHVKALEFPFMVSLEKPSCSFEDMVLQALEEGRYHLYQRADDEANAKVFRQSSLRSQAPRPSQAARASKTAPASRAAHDGGAAGSASSWAAPDLACDSQPMDFMATDVVMLALDKDSDGALSWHETCLSDADFVAAARLCTGCGEAASRLACLRGGAVGFDSVCGFDEAVAAAAAAASRHLNISRVHLDAYVNAFAFDHLDVSADGTLDPGESALLDSIATDLTALYQAAPAAAGAYLSFDVADGVSIEEYGIVTRLLREVYGTDVRRVHEHLDSLAGGASLGAIPEPFYSAIYNLTGLADGHMPSGDQLASALQGLTAAVMRAAGCGMLDGAAASGLGSGPGSGSGGDGSGRPAPAGYQGFVGTRRRRLLTQLPSYDNTIAWTQYCAATLVHPKWVVTAAGCLANMDLARIVNTHTAVLGGHECLGGGVHTRLECQAGATRARLSRVVLHPLFAVDPRYDVALMELEQEVLGFETAPLDDGSDLAFLPCKHPNLTAVGWWPTYDTASVADATPLRRQTLEYVDTRTCKQRHLDTLGYEEVGEHKLSICAAPAAGAIAGSTATCFRRGYFGQDGGPLLVPREGAPDGFVLAGIIRAGLGAGATPFGEGADAGHLCPDDALPRAHVRVAGVRQWLLSVSALGAAVPVKLGVALDKLHLPPAASASLRIYEGTTDEAHALLDTIDYDCGAAELEVRVSGGLVLVLSHEDARAAAEGTNVTACGQRVGLEEAWGRDCRPEQLQLSFRSLNCSTNAAEAPPPSAHGISASIACADPTRGGIEGCHVSLSRALSCSRVLSRARARLLLSLVFGYCRELSCRHALQHAACSMQHVRECGSLCLGALLLSSPCS